LQAVVANRSRIQDRTVTTRASGVRIVTECIDAVAGIAVAAATVPIARTAPILVAVISKARDPNRHKTKVVAAAAAAATSRGSRSRQPLIVHSRASGNPTRIRKFIDAALGPRFRGRTDRA